VLVEYPIPLKHTATARGEHVFFDIDVKGGESVVISRMLQWYSWMFFKGFPSMPKGEIVGMFSDRGRVCVFVIDGKDHDQ
jgi:hypothetical protein